MASSHGQIGEFDNTRELWETYSERLENYFIANGITGESREDQKRAIVLSVCGLSTYQLIRNLVAPHKPSEISYDQLRTVVKDHFHPRRSEIVERFHFNSRIRKPTETVGTFVAELRRLSEFCGYVPNLETMLRDRMVCGINHETMQRRLLAENNLTLVRAMEIAQRN